jgi:hypothetical protein
MVGRFSLLVCLVASACSAKLGGQSSDGPTAPVIDGPVHVDAAIDSPMVDALPAWSAPAAVPGANAPTMNIDDETLSNSQLEIYFGIIDDSLTGDPKQLWMMSRPTVNDAWGSAMELDSAFNAPAVGSGDAPTEEGPRLTPNDLTLYWGRDGTIYAATRTTTSDPWTVQGPVTQVNTAGEYGKWLAVCDNGYFMISRANGSNGQDFYEGQLGGNNGPGTVVTELNSTANETSTFLSNDCLTTYFASSRSGSSQIYTATRPTVASTWTTPTEVATFDTATDDEDPWISNDQLTFYFASTRFGGTNDNKGVFVSTR